MNLNKVMIAGRLTRDPELKALPSGKNICNFSLATSSTYKDRDGKTIETTEYHSIVVFGPSAENSAKYLLKGQLALVEGRLQTRSWEKDGVKHYRTEVLGDKVLFGPKPASDGPAAVTVPEYPEEEINPEDIPF
ncbi:single-stranded DNA-binding protein [Seohaeicola saemankumensis]|uniref:single-stranded DNA-binding protein n=1 Tax=Seohaeicola saemankumensis TaxID=481181 RepID=UPI001E65AF02|nr:single-stranded DNA-binding protein [Seohaeicola saemankumensis]MCD1627039.1 single-stranded DNA-binding protein [Seohaeicola saemankumensis]